MPISGKRMLPARVQLEFEGRYAAMLSHEPKNYALLRYDGTLVLHGVAFRSSRAEPFGEAFLRKAITHLLVAEVAAVRETYLATLGSCRREMCHRECESPKRLRSTWRFEKAGGSCLMKRCWQVAKRGGISVIVFACTERGTAGADCWRNRTKDILSWALSISGTTTSTTMRASSVKPLLPVLRARFLPVITRQFLRTPTR